VANVASSSGVLELQWETDPNGVTCYGLYERGEHGQLAFIDAMQQGPFDTALEVSQWAWRAISKRVPPSRC
jgi:hypothetical protein